MKEPNGLSHDPRYLDVKILDSRRHGRLERHRRAVVRNFPPAQPARPGRRTPRHTLQAAGENPAAIPLVVRLVSPSTLLSRLSSAARVWCLDGAGRADPHGRRTVCGMLVGEQLSRVWCPHRAHRFCSAARRSPEQLSAPGLESIPGRTRLPVFCHMADSENVAYGGRMAERVELDTKVSPEGRVVIPIEVRRVLEVAGGGRVRFVVVDGQVSVVSSRTLAVALWANNHGGDAGDSVADVRAGRSQDQDVEAQNQGRVASAVDSSANRDQRSDDEVAAGLLAAVGLVG